MKGINFINRLFKGAYTYEKTGARRVKASTSGNEKTRVSVAFCAAADGSKLSPIILIPRKKPLKDYIPPSSVVVVYGTNGTFNSDVISEHFIQGVLFQHVRRNRLMRPSLFIDSAPCHKKSELKTLVNSKHIKLNYIPPSMTNLLQPADVGWMGPIKKKFIDSWNNWYINDDKTFTRSNNLRSPGYEKVIDWIARAWEDLNPEIIKSSFEWCGITTSRRDEFHSALRQMLIEPITDYLVEETVDYDAHLIFSNPEKEDNEFELVSESEEEE